VRILWIKCDYARDKRKSFRKIERQERKRKCENFCVVSGSERRELWVNRTGRMEKFFRVFFLLYFCQRILSVVLRQQQRNIVRFHEISYNFIRFFMSLSHVILAFLMRVWNVVWKYFSHVFHVDSSVSHIWASNTYLLKLNSCIFIIIESNQNRASILLISKRVKRQNSAQISRRIALLNSYSPLQQVE
jgi:hypothetical protein